MVTLSDSESDAKEAAPVAVDNVREAEAVQPVPPEEQPEKTDSLLTFSSEGAATDDSYQESYEGSNVVRPVSPPQPQRPTSGYQVPVAIIDDRATREAVRKLGEYSETLVKLQALCAAIEHRLERAEETLQRAERVIAADALQELPARVDARLVQAEQVVHGIERTLASEALERQSSIQALRSHLVERFQQTEEIIRRSEAAIADRAVREVSACIDARVSGSDEVIRRIEQVVATRSSEELAALQALRADIDERLSHAEEILRRAEANLNRSRDDRITIPVVTETDVQSQASPWLVPHGAQSLMTSLAAGGVLVAVAILVLVMRVPIAGEPQPAPGGVDREVLVPEAPIATPAPPAPVATPTPAPTAAPTPTADRPPAQSRIPATARPAVQAPARRAAVSAPADNDVSPRAYVGDLSITSTPAGATVSINGRAVGVTPLVLNGRPAGSVAVQIARDGFERWSASIQVRSGQMTNVAATLRPAR